MSKELDYFVELWTIHTNYYYHKLPEYIEKGGKKAIKYEEIIPVYIWRKNIDFDGTVTWDVCPVDFSDPKNKGKSWGWSLTVNDYIGKTYFFTREEAENKYAEIPEDTRAQYEEIKQLKRLSV